MTKTFLIVDDDPVHGAYVEALLERHGFAAQRAPSAGAALELLARGNFAAVITDILMPEVDGLDLLRQIKQRNPDMPVVGITGSNNEFIPVLARAFISFGGLDLLSKPLSESDLLGLVRRISAV
jgi:two-component system C4-dicarboxylate transport response regulator DctD